MRTTIHIGPPKTGTTALQAALHGAPKKLHDSGVLYPRPVGGLDHHAYIAEAMRPHMSRWIASRHAGDLDDFQRQVEAQAEVIRSQTEMHPPEVLILSAEEFFFDLRYAKDTSALDWLDAHSDSVTVVAYARRPSERYLSLAQQVLKASHILPPTAYAMRGPLEGWLARYPETVHVRPYSSDIVADFLGTYAPAAAERIRPGRRPNESMSAEAMALLQEYRLQHHAHEPNHFSAESNDYLARLSAADVATPGLSRPRLLEEVAHAIDRAAVDTLWLREEFGVELPGVDYDHVHYEPVAAPERVDQFCHVDSARLAALHEVASPSARPSPA